MQPLVDHGQQLVAAGDVARACVSVVERAARAGDKSTALALGGTYDAAMLKQIEAIGITADPEKARSWWSKGQRLWLA